MWTIVGMLNRFAREQMEIRGKEYLCPHALGGIFLGRIAYEQGVSWLRPEGTEEIEYAKVVLSSQLVRLLRQRGIVQKMNECGPYLTPYLLDNLDPRTIIVVHDDMDLPLGRIAIGPGYGDHGHNGLKSLAEALGTDDFIRAQIGIGRPEEGSKDFLDQELKDEGQKLIEEAFEELRTKLEDYLQDPYPVPLPANLVRVTPEVALAAQIPGRKRNLAMSPVAVTITRTDAKFLEKAVNRLVAIIERTANKYARLCYDKNEKNDLVRLLEAGVPAALVTQIRHSQFSIHGLSFDFQSGRLLEINASPMPSFQSSNARELLGREGPGTKVTPELLCWRTQVLANRHQLGGRPGSVLLVDKIGQVPLGATGWFGTVADHLWSKGIPAAIGSVKDYPEADIIWANLTWMTPERWPDVLNLKALEGHADVFPSSRTFLFTSKWFLYLLSSPLGREALWISPSDCELLDQIVPFTRPLREAEDFIRFALRHNLRLYGKPFLSSGGRGGASITNWADIGKVAEPAVVQEWSPPYQLGEPLWFFHDLRVIVYGVGGNQHVWLARVWNPDSKTVVRPMDAPVIFAQA